jgi:hypothetical protein
MALYSGETILIKHSATMDGEALTSADVSTVSITIYNSDLDVVEAESPMIWNATKVRWEYPWDTSPTTALPAGVYRAKVYILSTDGAENWEYKKIRLKANPV